MCDRRLVSRRKQSRMPGFYDFLFMATTIVICSVYFVTGDDHQSLECRKTKKVIKCGNNTLATKPWWNRRKYNTLTLTKLSAHGEFSNKTLEISVDDKLQVIDDNSIETPQWQLRLNHAKTEEDASHFLLSTSDKVTFFSAPNNVHGYLSHHFAMALYKSALTENNYDLEILKPLKMVTLRITFDMTSDRKLGVLANDGHIAIHNSLNLSCVSLINTKRNMNGCWVIYGNVSFVTCECRFHGVQNFVVAVKTTITVWPHSKYILPTYFSLTFISTLFLILTLALLLRFRKSLTFGNTRFKVQVNLTISFLFRHLALLSGLGIAVFDPPNRVFCNIMAVLHLYFLTTSVLWILLEGVMIYRKVCKIDLNISIRNVCIAGVSVWVIPFALMVGISVFEISRDNLLHISETYLVMQERLMANNTKTDVVTSLLSGERKFCSCWVESELVGIVGSVIVSASLVINTVILIWVGILVWKIEAANNKNLPPEAPCFDSKKRCQIIRTFRAVAILTMVLGLPWLFILLYNIIIGIKNINSIAPSAVEFFFVFAQGPALFYLYCVQNQEFRHAFKRAITKKKLRRNVGKQRSNSNSASSLRQG